MRKTCSWEISSWSGLRPRRWELLLLLLLLEEDETGVVAVAVVVVVVAQGVVGVDEHGSTFGPGDGV